MIGDDIFQGTTCPEGMVSFPKSLPVLPSVTLIPTSWTKRRLLSFPRAGRYSGSLPKRPYSSCLRSILSEGSPYMFSPIHCSLLPSFVLFSSIVTSWLSQTPSKYYTFLTADKSIFLFLKKKNTFTNIIIYMYGRMCGWPPFKIIAHIWLKARIITIGSLFDQHTQFSYGRVYTDDDQGDNKYTNNNNDSKVSAPPSFPIPIVCYIVSR